MNKFKEKQEEWKLVTELHFKELQDHLELQEKAAVFYSTSFYFKLPVDLQVFIVPYVSNLKKTLSIYTKYKEMFGVIGNFLYTPELNKKKAKFMIENKET